MFHGCCQTIKIALRQAYTNKKRNGSGPGYKLTDTFILKEYKANISLIIKIQHFTTKINKTKIKTVIAAMFSESIYSFLYRDHA